MKAIDIINHLCCEAYVSENANVWHYYKDEEGNNNWEQLDGMFGLTKQICGKLEEVDYLYQYSDGKGVLSELPDVIIVLDDGRCVFLFKIEGV